ncbi:formin-like protein 3 isoform X2 [Branchiostoma floridae]|uniref:Formin-like protein 3 isoform X2 n=1 Tax=Branchiostoma floridae TaxID=7739 RepID=A0A9J7LWD9_BRAFL|nr:formin-like protein 3 isoform X2 [Branchiostoma floridae]
MGNGESTPDPALRHNTTAASMKSPMPDQTELEERFARVLASMDLPPDKAKVLRSYDNDKKWDLICDQERVQAKEPPHTYLQKLQGYMEVNTAKKSSRKMLESTQVLRDIEISLRTNNIEWVKEFLNQENSGLDVLVDYLTFTQIQIVSKDDTFGSMSANSSLRNMVGSSLYRLSHNYKPPSPHPNTHVYTPQ